MTNDPYNGLTDSQLYDHLISGISSYQLPYPSSIAHFEDVYSQYKLAILSSGTSEITKLSTGIFDREGLLSPFSSGLFSRNYAITDFKINNPYIHYAKSASAMTITVNPSSLLTRSTYEFNIYSKNFRTPSPSK